MEDMNCEMHDVMRKPEVLNRYLQAGRLVYLENHFFNEKWKKHFTETKFPSVEKLCELVNQMKNITWGWGIVLPFSQQFMPDRFFVDVLIPAYKDETTQNNIQPNISPTTDQITQLPTPLGPVAKQVMCRFYYIQKRLSNCFFLVCYSFFLLCKFYLVYALLVLFSKHSFC